MQATKHVIKFGEKSNTWIDAYVVPEIREVRYAPTAISLFLGRSKEYVSTVAERRQKLLKRLDDNGYNGCTLDLKIPGMRQTIKSLSGKDFEIFVVTESQGKEANPIALAHLSASFAIRKARLEEKLLLEVLGTVLEKDESALYSSIFDAYTEAFQANYDDWADISEQEEFIANPTVRWLNKLLLTATCYEDDPDCHQSK